MVAKGSLLGLKLAIERIPSIHHKPVTMHEACCLPRRSPNSVTKAGSVGCACHAGALANGRPGRCDPHPFGNLAHDHRHRAATLSLLLRAPLYGRGYLFGVTDRAMVSRLTRIRRTQQQAKANSAALKKERQPSVAKAAPRKK